jgi:hypothetical protein
MRVLQPMRSSHGDVAVSNTDDRRFDSFRACEHRITSPGTQLLDNCKGIVLGIGATPSPRTRVVALSQAPTRLRVTPDW